MKLSGGGVHPPAEVPRRPAAAATRHDSSVGSVAVLPLTNVNQDEDLEYLSDGLTDSLINNLSLVPHLRVLARSTVFRYKTERVDPIAVGHTLGVQAVLTGRVSRHENRLVVGAELVNVSEGTQIWGRRSPALSRMCFPCRTTSRARSPMRCGDGCRFRSRNIASQDPPPVRRPTSSISRACTF